MSRAEKLRARLQVLEADFLRRLVANLERTAAGYNTLFFITPESCPPDLPRHLLSTDTTELSALAGDIIEIRRAVGEPDDCPAQTFRQYLQRYAKQDPNDLGPIRMAAQFWDHLQGAG